MRDLLKFAYLCEALLDKIKIKYSKNIEYTVNHRAQSRLGLCKKQGDNYVIEISSKLLDERTSEQTLIETIIHEQLHTCYGCMKHTGRWKMYAQKVNSAYRFNVKRVAGEESIPESMLPKPKYIIKCTGCGLEIHRQRQSELVKNPNRFRCAKCGGKLRLL